MKKVICTLAVLASIALATAPAQAKVLMFLMGGQSNMAGCGITSELQSPYNAPQPAARFWNQCNPATGWPPGGAGDAWVDLQGGFGHQFYPGLSMFGPEVGFGHRLHELYPNDEIYLVKYGLSSTNLAVNWNPDGTGAVYNLFKARVNAAVQNLTAAGKSPEIAGMIWMQGESDAMDHTRAVAYETNLKNFITKVRSDFNTDDMPFVVGRINQSPYWGTPNDLATVRNAQVAVAGQMAHVSWIDTDKLPVFNGSEPGHADPDHYNTQGQIDLGILFANKLVQTPEPSTLVLAGTGLLAVAGYWRRKRPFHTHAVVVP
jgi:hypothetical protein